MKIKKIIYGLVATIVTAPTLALAQFETPSGTGLPAGSITGIITNGMNWLLIMVGVLGVIGFVIAGIIYLTAAGDEDQIDRGKKTMIASITGVIVALVGVVFIQAIKGMLGGNSKTF
ncbi:MAG: hypothetical protein WCJ51_01790 [Candidatus Moraniibacteriota bacterium]